MPEKVTEAIREYQESADELGCFVGEVLVPAEDYRLKISDLYLRHTEWVKKNGGVPFNDKAFMAELKKRFFVKLDYLIGNCKEPDEQGRAKPGFAKQNFRVWHYDLKK